MIVAESWTRSFSVHRFTIRNRDSITMRHPRRALTSGPNIFCDKASSVLVASVAAGAVVVPWSVVCTG